MTVALDDAYLALDKGNDAPNGSWLPTRGGLRGGSRGGSWWGVKGCVKRWIKRWIKGGVKGCVMRGCTKVW